MPEAVIHPTTQELTAFGLGKLPEHAAAAVAAHLEQCPACRQVVAGLMPDSFLDKLRATKPDGSSFPPGLARPGNAPGSAGRPAMPNVPCPDVPPELARHPKYLILRELGRGGMGVVYQARQTMMNRQVVIKVISKALLDHPDAVERFRREVHAAAQLSHPNIVTAHDAEEVCDLHMLVMEFVPGRSLAQVLEKKGPLAVAHACHFARQAALGLQHAFEQGMVHRDIKPQNLMLTPKGQVKILDFGLAKIASERGAAKGLTSTGAYMGTPDYSAPEQASDARAADIRADLYSLGCTLYCLLAGRPPFQEDTAVLTILAHMQKEATPLSETREDVPAELWAVVARLLAQDPARRYQTPMEVVKALSAFVGPGAQGAPPNSAPELSVGASGVKPDGPPAPAAKGAREKAAVPKPPTAVAGDTLTAGRPISRAPKAAAARSRRPRAAKPAPRKKWLIGGAAAACLLLLVLGGLWAAGVFKVKTADGILVVQVNEPNAEVFVDGERVTVTWGDGGKRAEVHVKPGTRKVEVKKDGFGVDGKELTIKDGDREVFLARLLPGTKQPDAPRVAGATDGAWLKEVAALPVEKQADAVAAKLKELNPGFDGKIQYQVEGGQVVSLEFLTVSVKTISPVRALPELRVLGCFGNYWGKDGQLADLTPLSGMKLTSLNCSDTQVADLSPLRGMPLTSLTCIATKVSDLSPLKDMKLTYLDCWGSPVSDLSPLKGMKLTTLFCAATQVADLSPVKDMKLTILHCENTRVSDLSPLKDMKLNDLMCGGTGVSDLLPLKDMMLTELRCENTRVSDLSPLKNMNLAILNCSRTRVSDLSPLKGMPLKEVWCDFQPQRDAEILRSIKTLERINGKPAAQFWKEVGGTKASGGSPTNGA